MNTLFWFLSDISILLFSVPRILHFTMTKCHISLAFSLMFLISNANSEVFTALADLEDLLDTEGVLINSLENYVKAEEQKLDLLRR